MNMTQHAQGMAGAIAFAASLLCAEAFAGDVAPHWQILSDKSAVEWTANYGGKPVTGTFPSFTSDIAFDPANLEASRAVIKIDIASVKSDDKDAQENLPTGDWFSAARFPTATFTSTAFTHVKDDDYQVEGDLAVRDKTVKITLPFTVKFYDDKDTSPPARYARIQGETTVKRIALGVGQGDWSQTDTVADDVKIVVRLEAKQVP